MDEQNGIITESMKWFSHPYNSESGIKEWFAFLTLTLIVSFLWSTVIRGIE